MAGESITITNMMKKVYKTYGFGEELFQLLGGDPEIGFSLIVWGKSGNGKSTFIAILCRLLSFFGKVYYNSIESGPGVVFQELAKHTNLEECGGNFTIGDRDTYGEMHKKLKTNRCRFFVIDSVQALGLSFSQWQQLKKDFPNKAIIMISWEGTGDNPKGEHAKAIRYLSDIKIQVKMGLALIDRRFGRTEPYKIPGIYEKFQEGIQAQKEQKKGIQKPSQPQLFPTEPEKQNL